MHSNTLPLLAILLAIVASSIGLKCWHEKKVMLANGLSVSLENAREITCGEEHDHCFYRRIGFHLGIGHLFARGCANSRKQPCQDVDKIVGNNTGATAVGPIESLGVLLECKPCWNNTCNSEKDLPAQKGHIDCPLSVKFDLGGKKQIKFDPFFNMQLDNTSISLDLFDATVNCYPNVEQCVTEAKCGLKDGGNVLISGCAAPRGGGKDAEKNALISLCKQFDAKYIEHKTEKANRTPKAPKPHQPNPTGNPGNSTNANVTSSTEMTSTTAGIGEHHHHDHQHNGLNCSCVTMEPSQSGSTSDITTTHPASSAGQLSWNIAVAIVMITLYVAGFVLY